jgi:acetylornithine deacetylase/succinyl-diaminopimelate desuccinylase-like protein
LNKLKEALESSLDVKETKELAVRVMKTDRSNSYCYDRDPKLHRYIQTVLRPQFDGLGIENYTDDYGNFVASMGKKKGKRVMIVQHSQEWGPSEEEPQTLSPIHEPGDIIDVAKLGIKGFDPAAYGVHGEVVWGRGGCEAAGGAIAATEAARMLARSGADIAGEALFVVTSGGHAAASDNIFHLVHNDELKVDMAIHQGHHWPAVTIGGRGRVDLRLAVLGKITHSSQDEGGSNALAGALVALERLKKIMPVPNGKVDPESGHKPRLTPIVMESYPKPPGHLWGTGSAGHTLQNLVRVTLDRRILRQENVDQAIKEIKDAIGDLSPWKYRVERGAYHFPWSVPKDAPVVKFASQAITEMLGFQPGYEYMTPAWDMGAVNRLGIPCVCYGTTGPMVIDPPIGPHCENDFATLEWIYDAAKVYAYFAATATA